MKRRCLLPTNKAWKDYGGRGITVCPRWLNDFEAFLSDMGLRPAQTSLDRIDNDGPYSPENCRWATNQQQARNKRTNSVHVFHGVAMTVAEASERYGVNRSKLYQRLRAGWQPNDAIV